MTEGEVKGQHPIPITWINLANVKDMDPATLQARLDELLARQEYLTDQIERLAELPDVHRFKRYSGELEELFTRIWNVERILQVVQT